MLYDLASMKTTVIRLVLAAAVMASVGCVDPEPPPVAGFMASVDDVTDRDSRHEAIPFFDTSEWVELYDPDESFGGYTLVLFRRRVPMLIDMQGRVVHSWPLVRAVGRARLDEQGRLTVIGIDDVIKEYDWDGSLTWAYRFPEQDDLPHHDFITLANGNLLAVARRMSPDTELLHEVDRDGRVVWSWRSVDHLDRHFPDRDMTVPDPTHINSLFELGPNRWFDAGDERFRPGNLLISARNLNAIFIIDKTTKEVVWLHRDGLDHQHEAQMIPPGLPGEGLIVLFNNGYGNFEAYRRSDVRVIDPVAGGIVWRYEDPTFFSSVAGIQQILPNGNLLVSSSEGGRVLEITPDKQRVWEWIPPYLPMRPHRYPPDHCPQLETVSGLDRRRVDRSDRPTWVDTELSRFAIANEYDPRVVHGKRRQLLKEIEGCRELLLPPEPMMQVAYGFDGETDAGAPREARFSMTVRRLAEDGVRVLVDETVRATGDVKRYRDRYLALEGLGLERVELCVDVETREAGSLHPSIFVSNPRAYSQARAELTKEWNEDRISQRERSLEERQLRALGYIQ
jgi:hypothetical protein